MKTSTATVRARLLSKQKRRSAIKRRTAKKERWSQWSHSWITFKVNKKETKNVNNEVRTQFVDTSGSCENVEDDGCEGNFSIQIRDDGKMRSRCGGKFWKIVLNLKGLKPMIFSIKLETIFWGITRATVRIRCSLFSQRTAIFTGFGWVEICLELKMRFKKLM